MLTRLLHKMKHEQDQPFYSMIPVLVIAILYVVTVNTTDVFSGRHNFGDLVVFPADGIALGAALFFGKRIWPGIFIGHFIAALNSGFGWMPSVEIAMIVSLEAVLAVHLFDEYKLDRRLIRLEDVLGLILIIVIILQPFSALLSNIIWLLQYMFNENIVYSKSLYSWWLDNMVEELLFAPFTLLFLINYKQIRLLEFFLYGLGFTLFIYLLEIKLDIENLSVLMTFTIPLATLIVAHKGMSYGTLYAVIIASVSVYAADRGIGVFSFNSDINNIINMNFFILTHVLTVLVVGVLFEERRRTNSEYHEHEERQLRVLQQSRLVQMGEMIAMIAHQWRQLLNNLSLVNQLLVMKYHRDTLEDDDVDLFKQKSQKLIEHMSGTIDDFRNFFRDEKEKKRFCINETIEKVLSMTDAMFTLHNIHIEFKAGQIYYAKGYPNEFFQAILNLVSNAKDALVERSREEKHIQIVIDETENDIVISIEDNAGGIPDAIIDKIFDHYFSTKENKNGTGLGLYMVKMIIIDHMHGNVTVSNTQEGVRFTIFLPKDM